MSSTHSSPRSILKHAAHARAVDGVPPPAVHFPPSPILTRAGLAHSPASYDRSPIAVQHNICALPERGCPGRTYTLCEPAEGSLPARVCASGRTLHPRAMQNGGVDGSISSPPLGITPSDPEYACAPALVPDLSASESEESDGLASPPLQYALFATSAGSKSTSSFPSWVSGVPPADGLLPGADPFVSGHDDTFPPSALAFLPHAADAAWSPGRRRRDSKKRSTQAQALVTAAVAVEDADGDADFRPLSAALSSCQLDVSDEGCLGGF
jgi:hypothetical protein